jgi:ABC-2 type transport system ATP-binding protein
VNPAKEVDLVVATYGLVRDYGGGAGLLGVDLAVPRNGVYGLVGPNGAGKTTLLSILAGLRRRDSGNIRIDVASASVVMCPDTPAFEPWLTAAEVIGQSRGLAHSRRDEHDADITANALAEVGLTEMAKRRVGGFSRGLLQRLGLAVALVLDPELIILDEPTSALDPAGRAEILGLIARLAHQRTVIFSSHILADVQRIADHVGILDRGRLLFQGPTQELIDAHLQPAWDLRVRGPVADLVDRLRQADWVTSVHTDDDGNLRIEGVSSEAGETGLPVVLAAAGIRLVSVNPVDADLEAAYLALTGNRKVAADG